MEPIVNVIEAGRDHNRAEAKRLALLDLKALDLEASPQRDQLLLQLFHWWMNKLTAAQPFINNTVHQQHVCNFVGRDTTGGGYCESCGKREPASYRQITIY
jgi:hypothetical protein